MAFLGKCDEHNISYLSADLCPTWWIMRNVPECPLCRLEWMEEHEYEWDFPVPYETMKGIVSRAVEDCTGVGK